MSLEDEPMVVNYFGPAPRAAGVYVGPPVDTRNFETLHMVFVRGDPLGIVSTINLSLLESDTPDVRDARLLCDPNPVACVERTQADVSWRCHRLGCQAGRKRYIRVVVEIVGSGLLPCAVLLELQRSRRWLATCDRTRFGDRSKVN